MHQVRRSCPHFTTEEHRQQRAMRPFRVLRKDRFVIIKPTLLAPQELLSKVKYHLPTLVQFFLGGKRLSTFLLFRKRMSNMLGVVL